MKKSPLQSIPPLVGREHELGLVHERWEQSTEGIGQVVLLRGEMGIGKSRLLQGLQERLAGAAYTRLECFCSPYHQHSILHPIVEALQRRLQWQPEDTPEGKRHTLEALLQPTGIAVEEVLPLFAPLFSLPLPAPSAVIERTPQQYKQQLFEVLLAWVLKETEQQPVCVIVEDLHWADPSTLEFLTLLIDQAPLVRLLVVLTCRLDFVSPWLGRSHLTQIALSRLPSPQIERMIARVTAGKALPAAVLQQLVEKTNGVPLFVEETTKMLLESGLLKEKEERYELAGPLPSLAIPVTLQDALMARLDRQGVGKTVAQLGATIGREFSYDMLLAVAPMSEEMLQQGLTQLVHAEILYQRGLPSQAQYHFKHVLIQETAYQSLLKATRQQYHQHIAQVLEERFPEICEREPELLAQHYTEAACQAQAIAACQRAGQRAMEYSAYVEATQHLSRGLALLASVPATLERQQHELTFHMALGTALMAVKGQTAPEVEQTYARAYTLCRQMQESTQLFPVLMGLWRFYGARAELQNAHTLAEQLMRVAQYTHNPEFLLEAHMAFGTTLFFEGAFATAGSHLAQGLALYDPQQHVAHAIRYGRDPGVVCASLQALVLWKLGHLEQALQMSRTALTQAQQRAHPLSSAFALYLAAILHQFCREPQQVQAHAEAALTLASTHKLGPWILGQAMTPRGWALVMLGQAEEGIAQIQQGIGILRSIGADMPWPFLHLVDAYRSLGRTAEGLGALEDSLGTYGLHNEPDLTHIKGQQRVFVEVPSLYWLKGELLLQLAVPDTEQAERCLQQALDLVRYQEAKSDELRIVMSLCRLWHSQGKSALAHSLLAETCGGFMEGLDTPDLIAAKTLLQALLSPHSTAIYNTEHATG